MSLSPSLAHILADVVIIIHLGFILFGVAGGLLIFKWPKLIWLHLPCLLWGALVELLGWYCPLTPLENYFRQAANLPMYSGDFIMEYIMPVIYPPELTRGLQVVFAIILLAINLFVYSVLFRRWYIKRNAHD